MAKKWFRNKRTGLVQAWDEGSAPALHAAAAKQGSGRDPHTRVALFEEITPEGGNGGSQPDLYANIGIGSNGDEGGSDTQWNLSKLRPSPFTPDYSIQNAMCGPITFAPGDPAIVFLNGPSAAALGAQTLTIVSVELCVANGAGTEKLIAGGSGLVWGSGGFNSLTLAVDTPVEQIGSDLSLSAGQIVSAAGGQYFVRANLLGQLT